MADLLEIINSQILAWTLGAILLNYTLYGVIYRLYLSPISSFPGPKLAALTFWYEFYYDIFPNKGRYTFHIRDLHAKFGPIIRINPYELHISDPQFYETLYSSTKKRDKWYWATKMFGLDDAAFATVDHNTHRMRRAALNPYFSSASVRRLQPVIEERLGVCLERLRALRGTGKVLKAQVFTSAFSIDVAMTYSFGKSQHRLESPDFGGALYEASHEANSLGPVMRHMVWILRIVQSLPDFMVKRLSPALAVFVELRLSMMKQVSEIAIEEDTTREDLSHPTVFHELLSSKLPGVEKTVGRLTEEASTIFAAAGDTVSWALSVTTYHLLSNSRVLGKLKAELAAAIPDSTDGVALTTLENLPYLNGVVKEGLRLSYGVSSRLARVPQEPLAFSAPGRTWIIPPGTPVGMTSTLIHQDESIFPKWHEFRPERWIEDPRLDRYLISFSKGSRMCLGMNLAYAEQYIWVSGIFRRFGSNEVRFEGDEGILELVETDVSDVELAADCFVPVVKADSKGVRFRVTL